MGKMAVSAKALLITFTENAEPQYKFTGAWDIRDLGRTRSTLFRAFKHYMRNIRLQNKEVIE